MLTTGQDIEREKSNFRTPFFLFFLRSCVFTPFVRRSEPRSTQKRTHTFFWCCYWRRWTWRISVLSFLSCFFFFNCFRFAFEIRIEFVIFVFYLRLVVRWNANAKFTRFTFETFGCMRCDYNWMQKITFIGNLSVCSCVFCCRSIRVRVKEIEGFFPSAATINPSMCCAKRYGLTGRARADCPALYIYIRNSELSGNFNYAAIHSIPSGCAMFRDGAIESFDVIW